MNEIKKSGTLTIAWILLFTLGALIALAGLQSLWIAYWGMGDAPAGVRLSDLAKVNPELPAALRGRRATAASFAFTCGVLLAWVAAAAFRRGERWAWFGLLCAFGAGLLLSILRILTVGTTAGTAGPGIALAVLVIALALSWRDFRK